MTEHMESIQGPYRYSYRLNENLSWKTDQWSLLTVGDMASFTHMPLHLGEGDDGGPWLMLKSEDTCSPGVLNTSKYQGAFTVANPQFGWTNLGTSGQKSDSQLGSLGATAMSRCTPTNPAFSLPTAIGELGADGLPSAVGHGLIKERAKAAKAAGGEYLNVQFGWLPLVSDVRSFAKTVQESHDIWTSYKKGSGMKTRVGYHFPAAEDSQGATGSHTPLPGNFSEGFLQGTTTQYRRRQSWFKGCFRYYVPEPKGFGGKMQYWQSEASKLLGIRLTPDTLWNLAPWSWAADWFANIGDLATNVSNMGTDGLVLQYGYAMDYESLYTYSVASKLGVTTTRTRLQKRCKRINANPYGFGVNFSTLSSRQVAIIAALGLSRS
jgi:hypothetical protein